MFHEQLKHAHAKTHAYCKVCLTDGKQLYTCGNCNKTSYCGEKCQTKDWEMHDCLQIGDFLDELPPGAYSTLIQYLDRNDVQNLKRVIKTLGRKLGYAWIAAVSWSFKFTMNDLRQLPEKSRGFFRKITVRRISKDQDVEFIAKKFKGLVDLRLSDYQGSIEPLIVVKDILTELNVSYNNQITDVNMLTNLTTLDASCNPRITDVSMLTNLTTLDAAGWSGITDVSTLVNLTALNASRNSGITDVSALVNLTELWANGNSGITDVSMLTNLTALWADGNSGITDVSNLVNLTFLYVPRRDPNSIRGIRPGTRVYK